MTARFEVVHRTEYDYDEEVSTSYGRAHLVPRDAAGQRTLTAQIGVHPAPAELREHIDFFGNTSSYFAVTAPHTELVVTAHCVVETARTPAAPAELDAIRWEQVRDGLDPDDPVRDYLLPSPLVRPSRAVTEYAAPTFTADRPVGATLVELLDRIHSDFSYRSGATTVRTTLPEVLRRREGVCQDFAHLAVGCLRSVGVPARYVSGYLETSPPPGLPKLQGADASHAWVSVFVPGHGWVDVDPTNNQFVDDRYVVLAWGRDYADVPPLKGVILTDAKSSTMRVSVDVTRIH